MKRDVFPEFPVLVVDADKHFLNSLDYELRSHDITNVECCQDSLEVLPRLSKNKYSLILLDLGMHGICGLELLLEIVALFPELPVIVITGEDKGKTAVECMKGGAVDYIVKPIDIKELIKSIHGCLNLEDTHKKVILSKKNQFASPNLKQENFSNIIGKSKKMQAVFETVVGIAVTPRPVLIMGETGVGKEPIARAIHAHSGRKGNFVPTNIAGKDDLLFSDNLFGHQKGAFTDAYQDQKGLVEIAENGTLFLDEIGDLSIQSQIKLLRLIQEGEYNRLGDVTTRYSNARIVAATHRNLKDLMRKGEFREDLYFRLQTHEIYIPPLRERKEDIPLLLDYFLEKSALELEKKKPTIPKELLTLLECYHFPGNVRELWDMVYTAVSRHKSGVLSMSSFFEKIKPGGLSASQEDELKEKKEVFGYPFPTFAEVEDSYIDEVMRRANGNISQAARLAGIGRRSFECRIKRSQRNPEF